MKPTNEQILTAAEWLDINDGELGESEACKAVAAWLRAKVEVSDTRKARNIAIKEIAKEKGMAPSAVRLALGLKI